MNEDHPGVAEVGASDDERAGFDAWFDNSRWKDIIPKSSRHYPRLLESYLAGCRVQPKDTE